METVRLDKWLWAVRIFKNRSLATEACKKGRVLINGNVAKASRDLRLDDKVTVRKLPVIYTYQVKKLIEKRVSAKLVEECLVDLTSLEELEKLKVNDSFFIKRERGSGRPTKKERRQIDRLKGN